jgi:hypothetical protein
MLREYVAIILRDDLPGKRLDVAVMASGLHEAKQLLEAEYGAGNVYYLHNEEDADRPR